MPKPRSNERTFIGGFNPVAECVINGGALIASYAVGLAISVVGFQGENLIKWIIWTCIAVAMFRAYRWYDKWLDREWRLQQLHLDYIHNLSDSEITPSNRANAIEVIENRDSKVAFSYVYFAIPYLVLIGTALWILDMHREIAAM